MSSDWTIGFITAGTQDHLLQLGIESAQREMPDAQIIVVGGERHWNNVDHIPFDESVKSGWITRKKNLIAQNAKGHNIAILHDYLALEEGWAKGVYAYGDDWSTCMHRVLNADGTRYRDWCVIYNDAWMEPPIDDEKPEFEPGRMMFYGTRGHERWQYYSGSYFCAKRSVLLRVPLDEERVMGQGEDVQWCRLLYKEYGPDVFSMNTFSAVKLLKYKDPVPWQRLPCL